MTCYGEYVRSPQVRTGFQTMPIAPAYKSTDIVPSTRR